jgi:hypothetical protein
MLQSPKLSREVQCSSNDDCCCSGKILKFIFTPFKPSLNSSSCVNAGIVFRNYMVREITSESWDMPDDTPL